jgi:hypothetical protein
MKEGTAMDDGWFDRQAARGPSDEETRYGLTALGQAALFSPRRRESGGTRGEETAPAEASRTAEHSVVARH